MLSLLVITNLKRGKQNNFNIEIIIGLLMCFRGSSSYQHLTIMWQKMQFQR
jgi:hypothetical protein